MSQFLPIDPPQALWTCGNKGWVIGFQNDHHIDEGDKVVPLDDEFILAQAVSVCEGITSAYTKSVLAYLKECSHMVGFGYSTTCVYQHVPPKSKQRGHGSSTIFHHAWTRPTVPIQRKVGHNFCGYAFSHYTSLCLVIQDGLCDCGVVVVAWGAWQRSSRLKMAKKCPSQQSKELLWYKTVDTGDDSTEESTGGSHELNEVIDVDDDSTGGSQAACDPGPLGIELSPLQMNADSNSFLEGKLDDIQQQDLEMLNESDGDKSQLHDPSHFWRGT
jgi:hypothetical protein